MGIIKEGDKQIIKEYSEELDINKFANLDHRKIFRNVVTDFIKFSRDQSLFCCRNIPREYLFMRVVYFYRKLH